jgi:hypothetical protein
MGIFLSGRWRFKKKKKKKKKEKCVLMGVELYTESE